LFTFPTFEFRKFSNFQIVSSFPLTLLLALPQYGIDDSVNMEWN
jgi:hypothetical protein